MKIEYDINPMKTRVFLTDTEKEILRLKIRLDECEETIYSAYFNLDKESKKNHPSLYNPKRAFEVLKYWVDEDCKVEDTGDNAREDETLAYCINELENGVHGGDCTCVACSCSKCHAESLVGVDTISGLGKHEGHAVDGAFRKHSTPEQVLAYLRKPLSMDPNDGYEGDKSWWHQSYVDRWNEEHKRAVKWLLQYWKEHNFYNEGEQK